MAHDRKIVITLSELKRIKQEAIEHAVKHLVEQNQEILTATAEDDLELLLVTGATALVEMRMSDEFLFEFAERVANIQTDIVSGKRNLEKMKKRLKHEHDFELRKEML